MGIEDTYNGAESGLTLMNAYIKTVAEEIGMDRAVDLLTKTCESMGTMQGQMLKDQADIEKFDIKSAWSLIKQVPEGIGIGAEIIKESQNEVVVKAGKCPIYSAGEMLGLDNKTMENICRKGPAKLMDSMIKELNPSLNYELRKFRSGADDFCEEAIIQG